MLLIKQNCELCLTSLPFNSTKAMICSFECTYCEDCVQNILKNVCPNCGGNFQYRPIRPKEKLDKYPAENKQYAISMNKEKHHQLMMKYINVKPEDR